MQNAGLITNLVQRAYQLGTTFLISTCTKTASHIYNGCTAKWMVGCGSTCDKFKRALLAFATYIDCAPPSAVHDGTIHHAVLSPKVT